MGYVRAYTFVWRTNLEKDEHERTLRNHFCVFFYGWTQFLGSSSFLSSSWFLMKITWIEFWFSSQFLFKIWSFKRFQKSRYDVCVFFIWNQNMSVMYVLDLKIETLLVYVTTCRKKHCWLEKMIGALPKKMIEASLKLSNRSEAG